MLCPPCEQEYAWHVMVCPACDVDTSTSCRGKIDYFVRGKGLQDLFGLGRTTNYSFAMGPAEFWVRAEDARQRTGAAAGSDCLEREPIVNR